MDQKLFQIPEIGLDKPVELYRKIGGNGSFDGAMDFGRTHAEFNRQAIVGPGLVTLSNQLEKNQDVLGLE